MATRRSKILPPGFQPRKRARPKGANPPGTIPRVEPRELPRMPGTPPVGKAVPLPGARDSARPSVKKPGIKQNELAGKRPVKKPGVKDAVQIPRRKDASGVKDAVQIPRRKDASGKTVVQRGSSRG